MIEYFESRAVKYQERSERGLWRLVREREWNTVAEALAPACGDSILELGCGAGFYARRLHALGAKVTAVDSSPAMLETLRDSGVTTVLVAAESFTSAVVHDKVLAAGVLEFVYDVDSVFLRARAALKERGCFVILIPTSGLAGRVYKAAHSCPVFVRPASLYIEAAKRCGFALQGSLSATPLSTVLVFH